MILLSCEIENGYYLVYGLIELKKCSMDDSVNFRLQIIVFDIKNYKLIINKHLFKIERKYYFL